MRHMVFDEGLIQPDQVFYDQVHTTGIDIRHPAHACAALTLGKDPSRLRRASTRKDPGGKRCFKVHLYGPPKRLRDQNVRTLV